MKNVQEEVKTRKGVLGGKYYPVTWYCNGMRPRKRSRYVVDLGLCGYSGEIAFLSVYKPNEPATQESLKALLIRDVYVEDNECGDKKWCINLSCPLNNADLDYFKKKGLRSRKDMENLHQRLLDIRKKLQLKVGKLGVMEVFKRPVVWFTKKKK